MYKYEESFFLSILQTEENKNYTFFVRTKPFRPENVLTIGPITVTLQFPLTKYFILVFFVIWIFDMKYFMCKCSSFDWY